jgi:hypothetical protein
MLPVIDYGDIAVIIPNVSAVGAIVKVDNGFGFEVYLTGREDPLIIGFFEENDAEESRKELIGIVAQYYFTREYGPDFEIEDLMEAMDEDDREELDEEINGDEETRDDNNKKEH